jgi:hypothetical protein
MGQGAGDLLDRTKSQLRLRTTFDSIFTDYDPFPGLPASRFSEIYSNLELLDSCRS